MAPDSLPKEEVHLRRRCDNHVEAKLTFVEITSPGPPAFVHRIWAEDTEAEEMNSLQGPHVVLREMVDDRG